MIEKQNRCLRRVCSVLLKGALDNCVSVLHFKVFTNLGKSMEEDASPTGRGILPHIKHRLIMFYSISGTAPWYNRSYGGVLCNDKAVSV